MMPDGNTAALRTHEAAQDRADRRHALHGAGAVESIVEDLFGGKKVADRTLHDFCDGVSAEEIAALLLASGDDRTAKLHAMEKAVKDAILVSCESGGLEDEVAEREREAVDDAKAAAGERE